MHIFFHFLISTKNTGNLCQAAKFRAASEAGVVYCFFNVGTPIRVHLKFILIIHAFSLVCLLYIVITKNKSWNFSMFRWYSSFLQGWTSQFLGQQFKIECHLSCRRLHVDKILTKIRFRLKPDFHGCFG